MSTTKQAIGRWRKDNRYSRAWDRIIGATPETRFKEMQHQAVWLGTHTDLQENDILDLMHDARMYNNMQINTSHFHSTLRRSVRHGKNNPRKEINPKPWAHMNNIKWWGDQFKGVRHSWEALASTYTAVLRNAIEYGEETKEGNIKRVLSYAIIGQLAGCTFGTAELRMKQLQKLGYIQKSPQQNPMGSTEWIIMQPPREEQKPPAEENSYPVNMGLPYYGKNRELIYHPSLESNNSFHKELTFFRAGLDEELSDEFNYVKDCPLRGFNEFRDLVPWPAANATIPDAVGVPGMLVLQTLAAMPDGKATTKELSDATGIRIGKVRDLMVLLQKMLPLLLSRGVVEGTRSVLWSFIDDFEIDRVGHELGYLYVGELRRQEARKRRVTFEQKKYSWIAATVRRVAYDNVVLVAHEWFKNLRDEEFAKTRRVLIDWIARGAGFKRLKLFQERIRGDAVAS